MQRATTTARSLEDWTDIARAHVHLRNYEEAILACDNGLASSGGTPSQQLHTYRATSCSKLGRFKDVVKDATAVIRMDPSGALAYFLASHALFKLGKHSNSWDILARGLSKASKDDAQYELLLDAQRKFKRLPNPSPPRRTDPIGYLPLEVVDVIFDEYLPFKAVVRCRQVSKTWERYITNRPFLWADLDFSAPSASFSEQFLIKCLEWANRGVKRLSLTTLPRSLCRAFFIALFVSHRRLSEITVPDGELLQCRPISFRLGRPTNLRRIAIGFSIPIAGVEKIMGAQLQLESAQFDKIKTRDVASWVQCMPNLKKLHLACDPPRGPFSSMSPAALLRSAPRLESIHLLNWVMPLPADCYDMWRDGTNLKSIYIWSSPYVAFPWLPPSLEYLGIFPDVRWYNTWDHPVQATVLRDIIVPNLTFLGLSNVSMLSQQHLEWLLDCRQPSDPSDSPTDGAPLEHLSLPGCSHLEPALRRLLDCPRIATPSLAFIDLSAFRLSDRDVIEMIEYLPGLTCVNLSQTAITGAAVKQLTDGLVAPGLQKLILNNCPYISSADAVLYARSKGVVVERRN